MEFTLSDIDTIYREHIKILDEKIRICYCKSIIDKAEINLNSKTNVNSELNKYLYDILFAAQNELNAILTKPV
jgi:hypothetical protein